MSHALRASAFVLTLALLGGCVSQIEVPRDARLIWVGTIDNPKHIDGITWPQYGQIYMVNDATGRVEGVQTVWPDKPGFKFELDRGRRYRAYFVEQSPPTTRPNGE